MEKDIWGAGDEGWCGEEGKGRGVAFIEKFKFSFLKILKDNIHAWLENYISKKTFNKGKIPSFFSEMKYIGFMYQNI